MTEEEMISILQSHLAKYREWGYSVLVDALERDGGFLAHTDVEASDGTECQLEFNIVWDDQPHGDVRVFGDLTAGAARPLWGFIPIYRPDVEDCFIMSLSGEFVDE